MIKYNFHIVCCLILLTLFSCDQDEQILPPYRQDLAEITTNEEGRASQIYFDDGRALNIRNNVSGLVPDTLYRILALYTENGTDIELNGAKSVFSPFPFVPKGIMIKSDPVILKALWMSKRYLNFLIGIKTGGEEVTLGFIEEGMDTFPSGTHKLKLRLYYDKMSNRPYYTQETYLSCPIYPYENILVRGKDSVEMRVNTFDGVQVMSFPYE